LIRPDYDLDHFLPWSFVTHDLIWNLTPAPRSINIQKSAAVPKLALYLQASLTNILAPCLYLEKALGRREAPG
jgi:hypothetical protein